MIRPIWLIDVVRHRIVISIVIMNVASILVRPTTHLVNIYFTVFYVTGGRVMIAGEKPKSGTETFTCIKDRICLFHCFKKLVIFNMLLIVRVFRHRGEKQPRERELLRGGVAEDQLLWYVQIRFVFRRGTENGQRTAWHVEVILRGETPYRVHQRTERRPLGIPADGPETYRNCTCIPPALTICMTGNTINRDTGVSAFTDIMSDSEGYLNRFTTFFDGSATHCRVIVRLWSIAGGVVNLVAGRHHHDG